MAAIDKDGNLLTWGCNDLGGLGRITRDNQSDNTESQEESEREPTVAKKNSVLAAAGGGFTLSMSKNGQVFMHGCFRSYEGKLYREKFLGDCVDDVPCDSMPVDFDGRQLRMIACGENFAAGITELGDLYTFGIAIEALGRVDIPNHVSFLCMQRASSLTLSCKELLIFSTFYYVSQFKLDDHGWR